jgi:branched-chain amino acid transport system ATP-binding protein
MSELLKVERVDALRRHSGGTRCLFTLREGEQATLIGANGAGKAPPCAPLPGWKALAAY